MTTDRQLKLRTAKPRGSLWAVFGEVPLFLFYFIIVAVGESWWSLVSRSQFESAFDEVVQSVQLSRAGAGGVLRGRRNTWIEVFDQKLQGERLKVFAVCEAESIHLS
jgi:hypothetical protein